MKPLAFLILLFCLTLTNSQAQSILLGIDVLEQSGFRALSGKRVGL